MMKSASRYRIRNWADYNKSLVQRGSLTVWFSDDAAKNWLEKPSSNMKKGHPRVYSDEAIVSALIIRGVFHLPLRALQGFLLSLVSLLQLALPVPDYSRICRRSASLGALIKRLSKKRPTDLVFDSTGLKVYGEGEWKVRQHGKTKRRTWRKVHLAICPDTNEIVMECLTENNVADCSVMVSMSPLIPPSVRRVYGDGAYDTSECRRVLANLGIESVIPPQKNAVVQESHNDPWRHFRNDAIAEIAGLGGDEKARSLWKKLKKYHRRSLAETAMFRLKTLFGGSLKSRTPANQRAEIMACCLAINEMNRLGMPKGEWILA
jgi:hypothetical protein